VSTIITTNLELSDWYELFQKKSLVDALLDRLQHHCITIRIDGPSLRSPEAPPPLRPASNHPPGQGAAAVKRSKALLQATPKLSRTRSTETKS
jgi:hypothetical protein